MILIFTNRCLGNDLNSNGSIPAATELTLFVVFTAPPLGTHTLFAQQSSPTEGYAVTISRDQGKCLILTISNKKILTILLSRKYSFCIVH
jgi:hypothetical protein